MSDNELRDRIADVIERSLAAWVNDIAPGSDHAAPDYAAQAIIDDLGLEVVSDGGRPVWKLQIVGKWEESDEQEPRP